MEQLVDKAVIAAKIESLRKRYKNLIFDVAYYDGLMDASEDILDFLDTLEVKEVEDSSLEKFKSLQHISEDLKQTLTYWGYSPHLYHFDETWAVDWISSGGDSVKSFEGGTPEEAIDKAYNWFHSTFCNG